MFEILEPKTQKKLSNCRVHVQTSISRLNWYLENNFYLLWLLDLRNNKTHFRQKKKSTRYSELTSKRTEVHFEGIGFSKKNKISWNFLGLGPQISRIFRKPMVRLSKPYSDCTNDYFVVTQIPVKNILFIISGVGAEIFGTSGEVFSALLSKMHFASPVDDSHTFSQHFLFFEHLRDMSSKCWDIRRKNLGTVFSKLHSSCTDEYFERKTVLEKIILHIMSFSEFNHKKSFGFSTEKIRRGCRNCLLCM